MSAINETLKYLIANRARLTPVDRAYLAFVEHNNGFSQQEVLRLSIIYAQLIKTDLKLMEAGKVPDHPKPFTTGRVSASNEMFEFSTGFDEQLITLVKRCKGVKWNPADKVWRSPVNGQTASEVLWLVKAGRFTADSNVPRICTDVIDKEKNQKILARAEESHFRLKPGFGRPDYQPKPFQNAGIFAALGFKHPAFADEMGLGKSIQSLGWTHELDAFPLLVVTKATLKFNFADEVDKAFPGKSVIICDTKTVISKPYDVIIINYDILSGGWENNKKKFVTFTDIAQQIIKHGFKGMIIDECHMIKASPGRKSQRAMACLQLGALAKHKAAISGTMIQNRNFELINVLKFLEVLDKIGGEWHFKTRYCNAKQIRIKGQMVWDFSGSSNNEELNDRLLSLCMVRRRKSEVLTELAPKTKINITTEITNQGEYTKAQKNVLKHYSDMKSKEAVFLDSIKYLTGEIKQSAIDSYRKSVEVKAAFAKVLIEYNVLRQITSKGKIKTLVERVEDILEEPGKKVIVFAYYKDTQKLVYEALKDYGAVTVFGDNTLEERTRAVYQFQNDAAVRVIVVSIMAGSDGLNLTAAEDVLFVETCMVPPTMDQCEDRAHRIGQLGNVNCHYFWAKQTIDFKIKDMLDGKRQIFEESINGAIRESLSEIDEILTVLESLAA